LALVLEFAFSLAAILAAAVLFTNAVEILGGGWAWVRVQSGACWRRSGPLCRRP
jgi:hypothetical protein